jgi:hypothetical protein
VIACEVRLPDFLASFTDSPKRIFELVGRSINAFSRCLQFIGLDSFNRSTLPAFDFWIFLKIDNFNFDHLAATSTLGWEHRIPEQIRFHSLPNWTKFAVERIFFVKESPGCLLL